MPEHYSPLAGFVIASVTAIAMPRLMERLKLPAVLGYIAAGVLIGPAMLGVVHKDGAVIKWLADIGKLLFMFFVGFEIDLALFNSTRSRAVVGATLGGKWLAARLTGLCFGYARAEALTMASLSSPQMAATLASAVVGYQAVNGKGERLLDAGFVNAVVLLVIVTCVVGPLLTERFAARLPERADASEL